MSPSKHLLPSDVSTVFLLTLVCIDPSAKLLFSDRAASQLWAAITNAATNCTQGSY